MKKLLAGFLLSGMLAGSAWAQSSPTVRVPLCLVFPDAKRYVPCTGVVPVDKDTGNALTWQAAMGGSAGSSDTVVKSNRTDRGTLVGTTSVTLIPANPNRRGYAVQVQSTNGVCWTNTEGNATADYHSLQISSSNYYESSNSQVSTGAVSIVCSVANTPVYAREW